MRTRIFTLSLLIACGFGLNAQQGGGALYSFLNVAPGSYGHSMGGSMVSVQSDDLSTTLQNPSLLQQDMFNSANFNLQFGFSGITSGYVGYGNEFKKRQINWSAGIQYTDYGNFIGADSWGNKTVDFGAADYSLVFGMSKQLNEQFSMGLNSKFIYSQYENYISTGIAWDIGGHYELPSKDASIGLVAKNIGFVLKAYSDRGGVMPFDLQLGFAKKLKYLPFRYHVTAHHLYKWDVRYSDPELVSSNLLGEDTGPSATAVFADNLFRHFIFGGEFLLGKSENLKLRFSYNHMLRREMLVSGLRGFTGFNGGVEFKIKRFVVGYSFGLQHQDGSSKMISIRTDLGKKKRG